MNSEDLLKSTDLQKIADIGAIIYTEVKSKYEPQENGKFLAIDVESKDVYLAPTSAGAVVSAKANHPDKVFYVVKIGFDAAETMAHLYAQK